MNRNSVSAWGLALCAAVAPVAMAQTSQPAEPAPAIQRSPGGIGYISGGGGEESRAAMATRRAELPLKIVLSRADGEYLVADRMRFSTPQGEVLVVQDAGPLVMLKLPPGQYTVETTALGKTDRRSLRVEAAAQTLDWRFPG